MVSAVLAKIQGTPRKGLIYKAFRAVPVLANEQNQAENEPILTVSVSEISSRRKEKSPANP